MYYTSALVHIYLFLSGTHLYQHLLSNCPELFTCTVELLVLEVLK